MSSERPGENRSRSAPRDDARVLVVNAGSSTWKLSVVEPDDATALSTTVDAPSSPGSGSAGSGSAGSGSAGSGSAGSGSAGSGPEESLRSFVSGAGKVDVVGHRIVHGGGEFTSAVVIDERTRAKLGALDELAPLHNPPALRGVDTVSALEPGVTQVACFDTSFHSTLPSQAHSYAVPSSWTRRWGLRRYGFHGLSCAYASRRGANIVGRSPDDPHLRTIVCHLGSGASVTAVRGGRSVDTTMGFTPLEGLVMSTRGGDVDPGVLLWVLSHGMSRRELGDALEHRSGLLGLSSGRTGDMPAILELRDAGDEEAAVAVDVYVHRLTAKIAAMAAATEGADLLVFTGGVGENSAFVRTEVCRRLGWMGVVLDDSANERAGGVPAAQAGAHSGAGDRDVSRSDSAVRVVVVRAREDLEIARQCRRLLAVGDDGTGSKGPG